MEAVILKATSKSIIENMTAEAEPALQIKVLIAEDNEINILLVRLFMEQWQFEFDIAKNGLEACKLFQKNHYDIVLMDLQMPLMDGYEAAVAIRSLCECTRADIPIIALTASPVREVKDKALSSGMDDCITKPFNPHELHSMIVNYTRRVKKEK